MSDSGTVSEPRFTAFVAIDWADRRHVYALEDAATGRRQTGTIEHTPEAVEAWVAELLQHRGGPVAVAIEQSRGALVAMLAPRQELLLYPIHTVTAARLRQAFFPSGAKDDQPDAVLLLDLLTRHRDRLRPLEPDTVEIRTLQLLVEQRRQLVDEKTRQKNRLTAQLKLYFPQLLEWFDDIDTALVREFLKRWPTLESLQRAREQTVLRFLEKHHSRSGKRNQQRLEAIRQARPATLDAAVGDGGPDGSRDATGVAGSSGPTHRGAGDADRATLQRARRFCALCGVTRCGTGTGAALAGSVWDAPGTLRHSGRSAGLQWDSAGHGAQRQARDGKFPLGVSEVSEADVPRVCGFFDPQIDLGEGLLRAAVRTGEVTPCGGASAGVQVDTNLVSLLAKQQAL